ncbi:MAG: hypothetical protein QOD00_1810 [Blastocatellia bacterium]|jgi:hypothetical protein|nr:hypothetical protein [Blastocatellia bacterium]
MNRKIKQILLVAFILVAAVIAIGCTGKGKRVISWSDKLTTSVQRLQDQRLISEQEAHDIKSGISDVRAGGVEYDAIEQEVAVTKEQKLSKQQRLTAVAQKIIESGRRLEQEGVLHVKNEQARKDLETGFRIADIAALLAG